MVCPWTLSALYVAELLVLLQGYLIWDSDGLK